MMNDVMTSHLFLDEMAPFNHPGSLRFETYGMQNATSPTFHNDGRCYRLIEQAEGLTV